MTHILPIILCIPWRDDDTVIHQLDAIISWNLAIFRPRVVKRNITCCLTSEKTRTLLMGYFCVLKSESAGVVREFYVIFMSVDNEVVFEFFCLFLCTWV